MSRPLLRLVVEPVAPSGDGPPTSPTEKSGERWVTDELFEGLRRGDTSAERELVALFWPRIGRTLMRLLGGGSEIEDLTQEVFIRVFARLDRVRDAASLRPFVTSTTVFVARETLRSRARKRWLVFSAPAELPEIELVGATPEVRRAVEAFYGVLEKLPLDERMAFSLRYVEGMELTEVAWATDVSLSTTKRKIKAAEARFAKLAADRPELAELLA
ncbi:MAG: sigma-70 family RNA polymerase sigma factor, partial [Myxococcales bacterium]|nr:sigma-70 family RNA polymerase sigma factor [Myxococcales bacterium]